MRAREEKSCRPIPSVVDGILEFVELRSPMHQHGLNFVDLLRFALKFSPLLVFVREEFFGTRHGGGYGVSGEVMRARYK